MYSKRYSEIYSDVVTSMIFYFPTDLLIAANTGVDFPVCYLNLSLMILWSSHRENFWLLCSAGVIKTSFLFWKISFSCFNNKFFSVSDKWEDLDWGFWLLAFWTIFFCDEDFFGVHEFSIFFWAISAYIFFEVVCRFSWTFEIFSIFLETYWIW